jgi:crossover junction endodeoxyribonuclease RuvC
VSYLTIGIDPGLSGAIAVLEPNGVLVALADLPVIRDKSLAWIDGGALSSWLLTHAAGSPKRAFVERVSAMPKQGVSSSFQFGVGFGAVLATLQCLQIPLELVTASKWKREMALGKDKKAALHKARLLWPTAELHLEKHHGRAEALLIAYWRIKQGAV